MLRLTCERAELTDGQGDPRTRLRLGFADPLDGGTVPE